MLPVLWILLGLIVGAGVSWLALLLEAKDGARRSIQMPRERDPRGKVQALHGAEPDPTWAHSSIPLKLKITEFQTKIEDTYVKEGNDRTALGERA